MIVVDTNIIASLYLQSENSRMAEDLLKKDPRWIAPLLWRSEFRSVLTQYIRKGILSLEQADVISQEAEKLLEVEYQAPSSDVLACAASTGCSSYDCEYVVLAVGLDVPFITLDQKMLKNHPQTAVPLEEFLAR